MRDFINAISGEANELLARILLPRRYIRHLQDVDIFARDGWKIADMREMAKDHFAKYPHA